MGSQPGLVLAEDLFRSGDGQDPFVAVEEEANYVKALEQEELFQSGEFSAPVPAQETDFVFDSASAAEAGQDEIFVPGLAEEDLFESARTTETDAVMALETDMAEQTDLFTAGEKAEDAIPLLPEEELFSAGQMDGGSQDSAEAPVSSEMTFSSGEGDEGDGLTQEERERQLAPFRALKPIPKGIQPTDNGQDAGLARVGAGFPTVYDPRGMDLVTGVRNQDPYGTCWAFSLTNCMESYLLKDGKGSFDFSENHMAYFFANRGNDPLNNTENDYNVVMGHYMEGGNTQMGALFLSTWSGMVLESQAPYPSDATHTQEIKRIPDAGLEYSRIAYLQEAVFSESVAVDRLKQLIQDYGAVSISLPFYETYYSPKFYSYNCPYSSFDATHTVTLVGWNDYFPCKNYSTLAKVSEDGAFICKNSWGEGWGDSGFFYLSYQCKGLTDALALAGTIKQNYRNNYFYDGTSVISTVLVLENENASGSGETGAANIYEVKAKEGYAEALGEVCVADTSSNNTYGVQIYTNLTDPEDPTSGTPAFASPLIWKKQYPGVGTFSLPQEVLLPQGSRFSVVLTNLGDTRIELLMDHSYEGTWFTSISSQEAGQSLYRIKEGEWVDALDDRNSCLRIKAHTRTLSSGVKLSVYPTTAQLISGERVVISPGLSLAIPNAKFRYASNNTKVARVSTNGTVIGLSPGTATILCCLDGATSVRAFCRIRVNPLKAPASVRTVGINYQMIRVNWSRIPYVTGYRIFRSDNGGNWRLVKAVGNETSAWYDNTVVLGDMYRYRVCAFRTILGNRYSGLTTLSPVSRVENLATPVVSASASGTKQATITWTRVAGATGYVLYRRIRDGSYARVAQLTEGTRSYTDKNLVAGTTYYYCVKAYRKVKGKNYYSARGVSGAVIAK
ncbi:MAG: Ig-like domain-containing protein [Blautia sp.]|nr:Ig-like domain-containing protein [Blautia sp.]